MDLMLGIEMVSVFFSLLFLILLMRENIWCWLFGIISSLLSIYLFISAKLYSESILYLFYAVLGVYGWWVWKRRDKSLTVTEWPMRYTVIGVFGSVALAFGLGYYFDHHSDAERPYVDATTTAFSFLASFLEAHKILSAWIYWVLINGTSIWLYFERGLQIYAGLMVIYFAMSIYGWIEWRKRFKQA